MKDSTEEKVVGFDELVARRKRAKVEGFVKQLSDTYGSELLDRLRLMHEDHLFTLQEVALEAGVTGEAIHQWYQRLFNKPYVRTRPEKDRPSERPLPIEKLSHMEPGTSIYKGTLAEVIFQDKCELLGYEVHIPPMTVFDFSVNKHVVEVKSCWTICYPNPGYEHGYWKFSIQEGQLFAEYLACYVSTLEKFSIIPTKELIKEKGMTGSLYVPVDPTRNNLFWKYLSAWELLCH